MFLQCTFSLVRSLLPREAIVSSYHPFAGDVAHLAIVLLGRETMLEITLFNPYRSMQTYEEILTLVQKLNLDDQFRLLEDLRLLIYEPVTVEGTDEVMSAESDAALRDYQAGRDPGLASAALKKKLFGRNVG